MTGNVFFQSSNLIVRRHVHPESKVTYVTFDPFADVISTRRPAFGEKFLQKHRISAYHFVHLGNEWYQFPEMLDAIAQVRAAIAPGQRVVTYGSSMGGYAAFRFGTALGADAVLAFSPQFSCDPLLVPWERRWIRFTRRLPFRWDRLPASRDLPVYVFYDPKDKDAWHMRLMARQVDVRPVPLPYAGHPCIAFLQELHLLGPVLLQMGMGTFEPAAFMQDAARRRAESGRYLSTRALTMSRFRRRERLALIQRAIALCPEVPWYRICAALILTAYHLPEEAEARYREAIAMAPDNPFMLNEFTAFLIRRRRYREAIATAERVLELAPGRKDYARRLARARLGLWGYVVPVL